MDSASMDKADTDLVVLVDENDVQRGTAPKLEVHRTGALHRAVSVFLFNDARALLLQRRARTKYHCAGLWSNTCCGHPRPGETPLDAAHRRLAQELGIACDVFPGIRFQYSAPVGNGLVENEVDHVFFGYYSGDPVPVASEVEEVRWRDMDALLADIARSPHEYTPWLGIALRLLDRRGIP